MGRREIWLPYAQPVGCGACRVRSVAPLSAQGCPGSLAAHPLRHAGDVHTDGIITSGGLIFTCIGNLLLFLVGSPYCQRGDGPPRRNGRSDVGSDAYDSNKNGSFDSPPTPIQSTSGATGAFNNV